MCCGTLFWDQHDKYCVHSVYIMHMKWCESCCNVILLDMLPRGNWFAAPLALSMHGCTDGKNTNIPLHNQHQQNASVVNKVCINYLMDIIRVPKMLQFIVFSQVGCQTQHMWIRLHLPCIKSMVTMLISQINQASVPLHSKRMGKKSIFLR